MSVPERDSVIYLDNEDVDLKYFKSIFTERYSVFVSKKIPEALDIIKAQKVKVVVFNGLVPDMQKTEFVYKVLTIDPFIVCVLLINDPMDYLQAPSIREAGLYLILSNTWKDFEMEQILINALEIYSLQDENQKLVSRLQSSRIKALESDRLKSAFLANLSHEIRTPLNGIIGFSSLLNDDSMNSEKLKRYQDIIDLSCNHLIMVLEDIFHISQIHAGEIKIMVVRFDLIYFLQCICKYFMTTAADKNITISFKSPLARPELIVETDKTKLHEVFAQLIKNALKFTNRGGIEVGFYLNKGIVFYVKDTGIGISKEKQSRIFHTFCQETDKAMSRNYGGNGLGLSIAKGLVEVLGGEIWFDSEKGKGSVFYFKIPIQVISQINTEFSKPMYL